ncbi:rhodanese-like domain-containing protein [Pelagibius sp.]|uniref:rhodanese-like domain-containing protein n=1 Tax=Pelagibius sp. TaxID=1931238 RepID=UPI00262DA69A|nr:rhodanese-like domain-containing protein [Pelagibius sp.]
MQDGYAGDLRPAEAWELLKENPKAVLVDVRTLPEWNFVGLPRLDSLSKETICVSWQSFPDMGMNAAFVEEVAARGVGKDQPVLLICRSGARSRSAAMALTAAGFGPCYNVAEGFEGDRDGDLHRGSVGGWKVAGLPWAQG